MKDIQPQLSKQIDLKINQISKRQMKALVKFFFVKARFEKGQEICKKYDKNRSEPLKNFIDILQQALKEHNLIISNPIYSSDPWVGCKCSTTDQILLSNSKKFQSSQDLTEFLSDFVVKENLYHAKNVEFKVQVLSFQLLQSDHQSLPLNQPIVGNKQIIINQPIISNQPTISNKPIINTQVTQMNLQNYQQHNQQYLPQSDFQSQKQQQQKQQNNIQYTPKLDTNIQSKQENEPDNINQGQIINKVQMKNIAEIMNNNRDLEYDDTTPYNNINEESVMFQDDNNEVINELNKRLNTLENDKKELKKQNIEQQKQMDQMKKEIEHMKKELNCIWEYLKNNSPNNLQEKKIINQNIQRIDYK